MKKILKLVIGIVVVVLVLGVAKDLIIKVSVEKGMEMVTGLKLTMGGFRVGILTTLVDIRNLRLFNPTGFKDRLMLVMPEIYVKYDLPAVMRGMIHLPEVRIALDEFVVVKNEKGILNLDSLKVVQANKAGQRPAGKAPQIQIDSLSLKIGKVVYKDYSAGGAPSVREFNVDINEKFSDIRDPYAVVSIIVVKALMNTSIANLANFDLNGLSGTVSDTLSGAQKAATEAVSKVSAQAQTVAAQTASKTAKAAEGAVQEAAGALSGILGNPFGSDKK